MKVSHILGQSLHIVYLLLIFRIPSLKTQQAVLQTYYLSNSLYLLLVRIRLITFSLKPTTLNTSYRSLHDIT